MPVSEDLLDKISDYYGSTVSSFVIEKSDYRDTSLVEKWLFTFDNHQRKIIYIKQYRKDYYSNYQQVSINEFEFAKRYETTFCNTDGFSVVIPALVIPEEGIIVSEEALGIDLYTLSLSKYNRFLNKKFLNKAYRLAGKGLKVFHEKSLSLKPFDFKEYKKYVDVRISKLLELDSNLFDNKDAKVINDFIKSIGDVLDEKPVMNSWLHGDYIPPNLIYGSNTVYLLDFLQLREGAILDEICYFLVFCKVQHSLPLSKYWSNLADEFVEGYDLHLDASQVPFAQLFYLKHLLNYLLQTSYWFRSGNLGGVRNQFHIMKYKYLKSTVIKHCSGYVSNSIKVRKSTSMIGE